MRWLLVVLLASPLAACGGSGRDRGTDDGNGGGGGGGGGDDSDAGADAGDDDGGPVQHLDTGGRPDRVPRIALSHSRIVFPPVQVGESAVLELIIENEGDGDLILERVTLATEHPEDLELTLSLRCPCGPFPKGIHQPIPVKFEPSAKRAVEGRITIESNDPDRPVINVPIETQLPAPELAVSTDRLEWASMDAAGGGTCAQDRRNDRQFTVSNSGSDTLLITGWLVGPPEAAEAFQVCPGRDEPYEPGREREWRVVFWPPSPGTWEGVLEIQSNAGIQRIDLAATDVRESHIAAAPGALAWPALAPGEDGKATVTLRNDGQFETVVSALDLVGEGVADAYSLGGPAVEAGLPATIPAGGEITVEITHTAAAEPVMGRLDVTHDADDAASPLEVSLLGTSEVPVLSVTPAAITFAAPPAGQRVYKHARVANAGTATLQVWSVAVTAPPGSPPDQPLLFNLDPRAWEGAIEPGDAEVFQVGYLWAQEEPDPDPEDGLPDDHACLLVSSDDPAAPEGGRCYPLRAILTPEGTPPTADIAVDPEGEVPVGAELTLDGSGSTDPDDGDSVVLWRWTLLAQPDASFAALEPAGDTATLTPDAAGTYDVALEVVDGTGLPSAEAIVSIQAAAAD